MPGTNPKIVVFGYTNYRTYLRDLFEAIRRESPEFSFRSFSRIAGFGSPSFLKLAIDGKRNLSAASVEKVVRALKFNQPEAEFFRNLVQLNQAKGIEQKDHFARQLLKSRAYRQQHPLTEAQHRYYSRWFLVPLRELIRTQAFREDPAWIARALQPPITPTEARVGLETLLELGLVTRGADGRLAQADAHVSTGDEVASATVSRFHQEMIRKGSEAIELHARERRDISALTVSVSEAKAAEIKVLLQKFRKELVALVATEESPANVFQLNLQFFPLSDTAAADRQTAGAEQAAAGPASGSAPGKEGTS